MQPTTDLEPTPPLAGVTASWGRSARVARWALVVLWLVWGFVLVLAGERESTLVALETDIASGEVTEVQVSDGLSEEARGYATVRLRWDRGLVTYTASAIEARPLGAAPPRGQRGLATRVLADVEDHLRSLDGDLALTRSSGNDPATTVLGWALPGWAGLLHGVVVLATLFSIVAAPQPWRMSRWGWFWLVALVPPLGVPAYLLLSGPLAPVPSPRRPERRLRGSDGFLLGIAGGVGVAFLVAWLT